jgi:hypothetical protein
MKEKQTEREVFSCFKKVPIGFIAAAIPLSGSFLRLAFQLQRTNERTNEQTCVSGKIIQG